MLTGSDELLAAAEFLAESQFTGPAAELRALAATYADPDPRKLRRYALRRIKWTYYPGMTRTAAAKEIASHWLIWLSDRGDELPDTLGAAFAQMERAGIRRVAYKTICNDLDVSFD